MPQTPSDCSFAGRVGWNRLPAHEVIDNPVGALAGAFVILTGLARWHPFLGTVAASAEAVIGQLVVRPNEEVSFRIERIAIELLAARAGLRHHARDGEPDHQGYESQTTKSHTSRVLDVDDREKPRRACDVAKRDRRQFVSPSEPCQFQAFRSA